MCTFKFAVFNCGGLAECFVITKQFSIEKAIEIFTIENEWCLKNKFIRRLPTIADVNERSIKYYYKDPEGCFTFCDKEKKESVQVWVIFYNDLKK